LQELQHQFPHKEILVEDIQDLTDTEVVEVELVEVAAVMVEDLDLLLLLLEPL
jgi:hypothetical protein